MNDSLVSPPFGQADLTNCERELIHLAGSIQPHGILLVLSLPELNVMQVGANLEEFLGVTAAQVLHSSIGDLGGDIKARIGKLVDTTDLSEPKPLRCRAGLNDSLCEFEGTVHRHSGGGLIVELTPVQWFAANQVDHHSYGERIQQQLADAVQRFSEATTIDSLADAVVQRFRDITQYDRVMVYKFDPDGHGEIIAEARASHLDSLLGHHYPASDIPQRARELYIRNRVRVLVDVNYTAVPLVPKYFPGSGEDLDMSLCYLRSMSPLHLQYLKNMGVTGTLVVSLVREGSLWGLIACHHYTPRNLPYSIRAVAELLAEVIATRIAAIENYVQAQVEVLVRRLELRLIEATSTEGDWRLALFRNPRTLMQPLNASGAALFYDGEILTAGDVPSTPELRSLVQWIEGRPIDSVFSCSSISRANPDMELLTQTASGVLAVELSPNQPDFLMWFRKEQPCEVTWAGDPAKPVLDNDPLKLSPRRSFAAWSEIVRGTAIPWTRAETVLARAIGSSLIDIILQIHAVRLLIAQHQLRQIRAQLVKSREPVVIADPDGQVMFTSDSFCQLFRQPPTHLERLIDLASLFTEPMPMRNILDALCSQRTPWRGEMTLMVSDWHTLPVGVRADSVPAHDGSILGFIILITDLTERKRAEAAQRHFEHSLSQAGHADAVREPGSMSLRAPDRVIGAILANANVAALEIADAAGQSSVAPLLQELEESTKRAAALYRQLRAYTRDY